MLLRVAEISSSYGRIPALSGVSIEVAEGELVALVGANGAGKTTLLNVISGVQPVTSGRIEYDETDLQPLSAVDRVARGIVQVPEGRRIFSPLSVRENLELGGYRRPRSRLNGLIEKIFEIFPVLAARQSAIAGTLSGGEQQMLAIGRALMSEPRLLLMDEPSLGLAPQVVALIFDRIAELNKAGMAILLVEQNVALALDLADRAYVLETGRTVLAGRGRELLANSNVQAAYLGA